MKKFAIGLLVGYLLTSIFSIPAPSDHFWYSAGSVSIIALILWSAWFRINNDSFEGDF